MASSACFRSLAWHCKQARIVRSRFCVDTSERPTGGSGQLGIPTFRDRVVQAAATLVLTPIFEADFRDTSYGFRPKRSATKHWERSGRAVRGAATACWTPTFETYFGRIDHERLVKLVGRRIRDRRVLKLLRHWLRRAGRTTGRWSATTGTPQGGVISPLLANVELHDFDRVWEDRCAKLGTLVRYADDFVVMCDTKAAVEEARRRVSTVLIRLGLELHPEKTRTVNSRVGARASTSSGVICGSA